MKNGSRFVCVNTTVQDSEEAARLSLLILKEKLAACVQWHEIASSYRWKGKIGNSREFAVICKTRASLSKRLAELIGKSHKYDVPEIVVTPILDGSRSYLDWMEEETLD